jgi:hypothetical protein
VLPRRHGVYRLLSHRTKASEPEDNKFTGKLVKVTINTKPSGLSAADQNAVENAEAGGGAFVD